MARAKTKLTQARLKKAAVGTIEWDGELRGFGCRITAGPTFTFIAQRDQHGRTKRLTFPEKGLDALHRAREWAREELRLLGKGHRGARVTLRQALEEHVSDMQNKECTPRAIATLRDRVERYGARLLDRDIQSLEPIELRELHRDLTEHGKYAANNGLRAVRAVLNTAAKLHAHLRRDLTSAVTYHKQRRRQEPIEDLAAWWTAVDELSNPIRRDLWLFILFTGLRRDDAKTVEWDHINWPAGTIHRPRPKGGVDHAFTVPLSRFALDLLRNRKATNPPDQGYVFPAFTKRGTSHIVTVQEYVYAEIDGKVRKVSHPVLKSPHRLRDTFATFAHSAQVDPITLKVLMNHRLPNDDVTAGYIRPTMEILRAGIEKISSKLLETAGRAGYVPQAASARSSAG
ncbi:MAG: tyrosine-type recombinase/integrase [Planctomycetota bacterium]